MFQLHLLLPGTLSRVLNALAESAKGCASRPAQVEKIIRQIRVVQLLVNLFNVGHRNITYCLKLLCITVSIANGYGLIAHWKENIVFLLLASSINCDLFFVYKFVYEKAFAIPGDVERVRRKLTVAIQRMKNATLKRTIRKQLKPTD